MKMQSICPDIVLEDPREDYKTAVRVEQYRVSRQAIYFAAFPGTRYLSSRLRIFAMMIPPTISYRFIIMRRRLFYKQKSCSGSSKA